MSIAEKSTVVLAWSNNNARWTTKEDLTVEEKNVGYSYIELEVVTSASGNVTVQLKAAGVKR